MPLRTSAPAMAPGVSLFTAETRLAVAGAYAGLRRPECSTSDAVARSRSQCPLGLIGMLAIIGAAQCVFGLRRDVRDSGGRVEMSWLEAARAARGLEGQADVLCFGDSRIKLGILPLVLHDRLGVSAYNLGILGGQAPSTYFLLRRVLERGNRPRAILIDFSESLLTFSPTGNASCWPDWIGWRESLDVAWNAKDPALALSTALHGFLPGWCDQSDRSPLFRLGSENDGGARSADENAVFQRNWRLNGGAQVAPRAFVQVAETREEAAGIWRPHPANAFYVDRLLRLAQGCGIAVYWILPPSVPARRERLQRNGVTAQYRQFVAARVAEFSCLTVLDGERLGWAAHEFRDPLHLNRDGAVRLSLAVAAATAPRPVDQSSGPRWVDLAASDDQEITKYQSLMEDLDQSRAAIEPIQVSQRSGEAKAW
jgi:hypothetical protein